MTSKTILSNLKRAFYYLCLFLASLLAIFLIIWGYYWSLISSIVLLVSFLGAILVYFTDANKKTASKFLWLGFSLYLLVTPFNIAQYNMIAERLQTKITKKQPLTHKEMMGIYMSLMLITGFDLVALPEAGQQNYQMFFPSEEPVRIFRSNSFLKSPSIDSAVRIKKEGYVDWNKWQFVFNKDFRYAVAFDPCTIRIRQEADQQVIYLKTYFGYRKDHVTVHGTRFFFGIFKLRVDEGLFWYLQDQKWIYPYTALWIAKKSPN